jgi:tetratricopeptide (TPR) repeat protein
MTRPVIIALLCCLLFADWQSANAAKLDELSLDRWAKLREVERYQLKIAEKYYAERNYKVALSEYEKFLELYEQSVGAPYSQLKWSICLVRLKKLNTAVRDGFQSVIDYWPESPEATAAAYYIGQTYKGMGEVRKAKRAYQNVVKVHPKHLVAIYAMHDLVDLASIEKDVDTQVELWTKLTFESKRNRRDSSNSICTTASQNLAKFQFHAGKFKDGVKALQTTYNEQQVPYYVWYFGRYAISAKVAKEDDRAKGYKLTDEAAAWIRGQIKPGTTEEEKKLALAGWFVIADLHATSLRPKKVEETYASIQKQFGAKDEVLLRFGNWLKGQKRHDQARIQFGKFENKVAGQNQIAYSFREEKKWDLAVAGYQKVISLDADNQSKWNSQIAMTHREARQYPKAVAVYVGLIKSDPENSETWIWETAETYQAAKQWKEAIGYYRQSNDFPKNNNAMAYCHRRLKQYKEAIGLYGQVMGASPKSAPLALIQIAYTQEEAGKKDLAIQALQQVCKRFPKNSYASQAHARLQDKYKISVTLGGATEK